MADETADAAIGGFGFGFPFALLATLGFGVRDVTVPQAEPQTDLKSRVGAFVEDFMDPLVTAFLLRLETGDFRAFRAIVFSREAPGALQAFHYACELRRIGVLPDTMPDLLLANLIPATTREAMVFNRTEVARVVDALRALVPRPRAPEPVAWRDVFASLAARQAGGQIDGATAFALRQDFLRQPERPLSLPETDTISADQNTRRRLALFGAPHACPDLHTVLTGHGILVTDQQALDMAWANVSGDLEACLEAFAGNPFAARQTQDSYAGAVADCIRRQKIDTLVWSVDPHDDLWGWLAPEIRAVAAHTGARFVDLGFVPQWPGPVDLQQVRVRLAEALA